MRDDSQDEVRQPNDDKHPLSTSSSLIIELQEMKPERWRVFVRLYTPLLLYWLRRYGTSRQIEDDLLQECLTSIAAGIHRFSRRTATGSFRGWLRTIVQRRVADSRRTTSSEIVSVSADLSTFPVHVSSADDLEAERRAFEDLRVRAMELARQNCTENSWQMFWQTVVEDRPTAEVATAFGVSAAAVRMARGRVLSLLREYLVEDLPLEES